jgi:putative flavoprotein involved in K+ transport
MAKLDAVIVGAGQAGLGVSYFLQQNGLRHIVFEKGQIGESWLSQRWDSFRLNTPNFMNVLPGLAYDGLEPHGFWSRDEYVHYLQDYDEQWHLPVQTNTTVVSVEQPHREDGFVVRVKAEGQTEQSVTSRSIVIASGSRFAV